MSAPRTTSVFAGGLFCWPAADDQQLHELAGPVPLEKRICLVICGSSGCQAARVYSLIRPLRTGFRWIRFAVEVGNGEEVATVVFAVART